MARGVDPIRLAVIAGALRSLVDEMTVIVRNTARSPILAIGNDFSNAVYTTANGIPEMVVQGEDQPVHLGGMLLAAKSVASVYSENLAPGDIIMRNDPPSGGSHLIDIDIMSPVFWEEQVVAWACSRAHMGDIGGPVPGGYNPDAEDIFAEGLRIPPVKLAERGTINEELWNLVLANVRIPALMRGDMGAQMSAVRVATMRMESLFARFGGDTCNAAMRELLDRSERVMRSQVEKMPDGEFSGESWLQEDGRGTPDVRISCKIKICDDRMRITLDPVPACRSYRNSYGGTTIGAIYYAIISGLEAGLPINEGLYRPLEIDLGPRGTMLNAAYPAACAKSTGDTWAIVFEAVADTMSKIVPDRACAGWSGTAVATFSGIDPRDDEPYSTGPLAITEWGGSGAVFGQDGGGLWGIICTGGAASVGDVEILELRLPWQIHCHELRRDSGCPGRWRGALGAVADIEMVEHEAVVAHIGDGTKFPSPGRLGAGSSRDRVDRVHEKLVVRRGGQREVLPLHSVVKLSAGDRLISNTAGGGGVGLPLERDPRSVAEDVREGYVSLESADAEYGVVLHPVSLEVDEETTLAKRSALRKAAATGVPGP